MKCSQMTVTLETLDHIVILAYRLIDWLCVFFSISLSVVSMQTENSDEEIQLNDRIKLNSMKSIQSVSRWRDTWCNNIKYWRIIIGKKETMMMHLPTYKSNIFEIKRRIDFTTKASSIRKQTEITGTLDRKVSFAFWIYTQYREERKKTLKQVHF